MIPFKEVHVLDKNAEFLGVPTNQLMENAGRAVANEIKKSFHEKKVTIFCGLGNNGGDGFVAARYLSKDYDVSVILLGKSEKIKSNISKKNFEKIRNLVKIFKFDEIDLKNFLDSEIVVDSMLGIGITGKLREPYQSCVNFINSLNVPIIAVDVPSGLGGELAVKPTITVTFHDKKIGMNKKNCGEIIVADIGIPKDADRFVGPGEFFYYPKPSIDSHKGQNGKLLVIGGGPYTGAPALNGLAALRSGVDLVHIATPLISYPIIASFSPNFIVHPLNCDILVNNDVKKINNLISIVDSVLVGSGLGSDEKTKEAVISIVKKCKKPIVIDADAIEAVKTLIFNNNCVLTPHIGEFKKLGGKISDNPKKQGNNVKELAKKLKATILLKSKIDIISNGKSLKLNRTGNPGMSVGGTGDVLAGIVGCMLAKGIEPFNAARISAFLCGYAGDLAYNEKNYSMLATDVIEKIPQVFKDFGF